VKKCSYSMPRASNPKAKMADANDIAGRRYHTARRCFFNGGHELRWFKLKARVPGVYGRRVELIRAAHKFRLELVRFWLSDRYLSTYKENKSSTLNQLRVHSSYLTATASSLNMLSNSPFNGCRYRALDGSVLPYDLQRVEV